MSGIEQLKQKLEVDSAFKNELQHSANAEELLQKIKDAGFNVAPQDLMNTVPSGEEGALDDSDLEAVAGGGFWSDFWIGFKYGFTNPGEAIALLIEEI